MSTETCEDDIFKYGESLGMFDMPKEQAEQYCKDETERTGYQHDWHYVAGRVHVLALTPAALELMPFQKRVAPWMQVCFGQKISADMAERCHRFFEEATEKVQAHGMTRSECYQLVDYTFNRPVGDPAQETGGVMVTLAALDLAAGIDMHAAADTEFRRINNPETIQKIRAKQAAKPWHSPLPEAAAPHTNQVVPVVRGVGRDIDNPKSLCLYFDRELSDDELVIVHETLKRAAAPQQHAPEGYVSHDAYRGAMERAYLAEKRLKAAETELAELRQAQQQGEPVAYLTVHNDAAHKPGQKELTFDKPHSRTDWDVFALFTQPLTADASFNQGVEESVNRAAAFVANNECEIDLAGLAQEIRNGKRPTDMVTISRTKLEEAFSDDGVNLTKLVEVVSRELEGK